MNAIVLIALKRPYTFVVLAILILIFGGHAVLSTPTDIFPNIGIPVVAVVWTYNGLTPEDMSGRVVYYYERALTTTVSNIEHIESQSLYGRGIVKIFFQPRTDVAAAQAQVAAVSQTVLKQMPAGITPPLVLSYNASSVPVLDLQISADQMTGAELFDIASNLIRPQLVSVPGVAVPTPYGGTLNAVEVDLDQQKLLALGLSAQDVSAALAKQDIVLPAGDQKIGTIDFLVETNAQPVNVATFNSLPIKQVGNTVVTVADVAHVHRGGQPQTNAVLVHGRQAVLLQVLKAGDASTLAIVAGVKAKIPEIERTLPAGVKITALNDASTFVRASIEDVVQEMATAGVLTGMIVLLFLGSGRSTLIVATSIPLSILCSILALSWAGQSINVMTLGGLALAVGILVDDATVMIENIDAHLARGMELEPAIIEAANQIVVPTLVSTLCICIVWLPLIQLSGVSRVPVPAARRSHHLRDDRLLHPFAHARADDGSLSATRAGEPRRGGHRAQRFFPPVSGGIRATIRPVSRALPGAAVESGCAARPVHPDIPRGGPRFGGRARALAWAGFFSEYQVGRDRHAFPCADRHAYRGGQQGRGVGGHGSAPLVAGPCHQRPRQLRATGQRPQPGLQRERHHRTAGL
jgi:multidrug efflux pump subunit AcrB